MSSVAVLVATYRRPALLARLLAALRAEVLEARAAGHRVEVVVVDNDAGGSGRAAFEAAVGCGESGWRCEIEERPGIAAARNRLLELSTGCELVAFIDDDEVPEPGWLAALIQAHTSFDADVVLGSVRYRFERPPSPLVAAAGCFRDRRRPTGSPPPWPSTDNVLIRRRVLDDHGIRFREEFGLSGGSDTLLFRELDAAGARAVCCEDAVVVEAVPPERSRLGWVLRRNFRIGNTHAWFDRALGCGPLTVGLRLAKAARKALTGLGWMAASLPTRNRRHLVRGMSRVARAAGMVAGLVGYRYLEYRRPANAALYVLDRFPVASETFVMDEIDALRDRGIEVMVLSLHGPDGDVVLGRWRVRDPRVVAEALRLVLRRPASLRALRPGPIDRWTRLKLLAAASQARRRGVSAIHAHFAWRSADAAAVVGRALGVGHTLTTHARDIFVPDPALERRLAEARRIRTVCEYNRRWLTGHLGVAPSAVTVIPCCTDVSAQPEDVLRAPDMVLAVGRLVPKKGFDTLIEAVPLLPASARVVIVGDGDQRAPLEHRAVALGVADRVELVGWADHDAVREWMRHASIFCLPCRIAPDGDRDSMPVVVKEAMAAGLPVVASDEVGVPEMVEHGHSGLLVPPDDPGALAAALSKLLDDPALAARMGRHGRDVVHRRFDLRQQATEMADFLFPGDR